MTLNEIKIEALKLMFTTYEEDINDVEKLINDDNYSAYIMGMNGAINRAVARLKSKSVFKKPFKILASDFASVDNNKDLNDAITIPLTDEEITEIKQKVNDDNPTLTDEEIAVKQALAIIAVEKERKVEIPLDVQVLIPYYIKADLFEEDEPALSATARNIFEQNIEDRNYEPEQEEIINVFRCGWLG